MSNTSDSTTIPYGYCHCGCGQKTKIAKRTRAERGHIYGEPYRFINGHQNKTPPVQTFWSHIDKTTSPNGCWVWSGQTHKGYGRIKVNGKKCLAHRVAWELINGEIPDNMCVCHKCDNPPCCNPAHLFLGTKADNNRDKTEKGRAAKGENFKMAKLTDAQVHELRARYAEGGITQRSLAMEYGICVTYVSDIVCRKYRY